MLRRYFRGILIYVFAFSGIFSSELLAEENKESADSVIAAGPTETELAGLTDTVLMNFVKYKSIQYPDSIFFNVLKIENRTSTPINGKLKINVPEGWILISREELSVNLAAGGKKFVPVRLIMARNAKGGIAYIVSAILRSTTPFQMNGRKSMTLQGVCYISTPKITKWRVYSPEKVIYMSPQIEYEKFELHFENTGNAEELVKVEFDIGSSIKMTGVISKTYVEMIKLPANRDTIISYQVRSTLDEEDDIIYNWKESSIRIVASTGSKSMQVNMWFKYLKSFYDNRQNQGNTPLTVQLVASNLLANFRPNLNLYTHGTLLLANNQDLNYYLMNPDLSNNRKFNNASYGKSLWQQSRFRVDYRNHRNIHIAVGDIGAGRAAGIYGRGIQGRYFLGYNTFEAAVVRNVYQPINGGVLSHEIIFQTPIIQSLRTGLVYINDEFNRINTTAASLGAVASFPKSHRVNARVGYSSNVHYYNDSTFVLTDSTYVQTDDPNSVLTGIDYHLTYSGKVDKFRFNFNNRYGSQNSAGPYRGRFILNGNVFYSISSKYSATLAYSKNNYNLVRYNRGVKITQLPMTLDTYRLLLKGRFNRKTFYSIGPHIEYYSLSRYDAIEATIVPLRTVSPKVYARLSYRDDKSNFIMPYVYMGYTQVLEASDSAFGKDFEFLDPFSRPFYNARVGLNVKRKEWGLNVYYYYGPYSIYTQFGYVYGGTFHKSIRIMPYFEKYVANDKIKLTSYNGYSFDATSNTERINLHLRIEYHHKQGWTFHVNNNLSLSNRIDPEFGRRSNRGYYFDVGVGKRFDIPQPRVKYYDLKVVCFEDLNGDKVMDENEAGLDYVLIKIDRDLEADSVPLGKFIYAELATDPLGEINYYDIPEGSFKMELLPLNNIGDLYNLNGSEQKFIIGANTTIYVPFVKANKVVGRIVFERDEYSSEGAINLGDVRISAVDSLGNTYSCLTDNDGHFTLFVPQTGRSVVSINNIFGNYFELEQEEFLVDFNGFKEFEVIFKFIEQPRGINIGGGSGATNGNIFNGRSVNGEGPGGAGNQSGDPGGAGDGPGSSDSQPDSGQPDVSPDNSNASGTRDRNDPEAPAAGDISLRDSGESLPLFLEGKSITWNETEYYIVVSAFSGEAAAKTFVDELDNNENVLIVRSQDNLQFLAIYAYRTEEEARDDLKTRQSITPAAWITKKE